MDKRMKIISISCAALVVVTLGVFGVYKFRQGRIVDFKPLRDTKAILDNFEDNKYWLLAEELWGKFDVKKMLETRSPNENPQYQGKLIIKVVREGADTVAFTTYYRMSPEIGWIQFVSVNRDARGHGYGRLIVDHDVKEFFKQGCREVRLLTRLNNKWARRIYEAYGFVAYQNDDRFIYYSYKKPN